MKTIQNAKIHTPNVNIHTERSETTRGWKAVKLPKIVTSPVYVNHTPVDMDRRGPNRGGSIKYPSETSRVLDHEEICGGY